MEQEVESLIFRPISTAPRVRDVVLIGRGWVNPPGEYSRNGQSPDVRYMMWHGSGWTAKNSGGSFTVGFWPDHWMSDAQVVG